MQLRNFLQGLDRFESQLIAVHAGGEFPALKMGNFRGHHGAASVLLDQFGYRIERQQSPLIDDSHSITQSLCFFHVVGRVEDG